MIIVVGIITNENKVLVGKLRAERLNDFGGIEYIFPGGKTEENESPDEAIIREIKEETNLNCEIISSIGTRIHPKTQKEMVYFHLTPLTDTISSKDPENDDIEELVWIEISIIKDYMPTIFEKIIEYLSNTH